MPAGDSPVLPLGDSVSHPSSPRLPTAPVPPPPGLERLNRSSVEAAEETLLGCCGSRTWARRLAAHRPYPDPESLLAACDEASYDLAPDDLAEALSCEGALQAPPDGTHGPGTPAARTALLAAHAVYESRFGHVFVVHTADCPPEEVLDRVLVSLHERLGNQPEEERAVTAEELRRIARSRLTDLMARA